MTAAAAPHATPPAPLPAVRVDGDGATDGAFVPRRPRVYLHRPADAPQAVAEARAARAEAEA